MKMGTIKEFFELVMIIIWTVLFVMPSKGLAWLWRKDFVRTVVVLMIIYIASIQFICQDLQNVLIWSIESRGYFTLGILIILGMSYLSTVLVKKG